MKMNSRTLQWLAWVALAPAAVALVLLLAAGPGARFGAWPFPVAFALMRWAAYLGLAGVALAVLAGALRLRQRRPVFWCLLAVVLGATAAWVPWHQLRTARSLPPIHDITTDPDHPPAFAAIVPLRGADANPLEYGGAEVARQQREAYPDIAPLVIAQPRPAAWGRALGIAKDMGWQVVAQDEASGRIEAIATTFWFGFKDDVVVRVVAVDDNHSRIDVRSVSRVGKSDLGANARRIRDYLAAVRG